MSHQVQLVTPEDSTSNTLRNQFQEEYTNTGIADDDIYPGDRVFLIVTKSSLPHEHAAGRH